MITSDGDLTDLHDDSELMWDVGAIFGPGDIDGQITATDDTRDRHTIVQFAARKRKRVDTWRL